MAPSPIKVPILVDWLSYYPNIPQRNILLEGFLHGFRLGYSGIRVARESNCLPTALRNPSATWIKLNKEISLGRIVGPFSSRPLPRLQCSPIGIIEKKQPGEFRLITHLSFPAGSSINDGIPFEMSNVKYTSFDCAVIMVQKQGKGALMEKCDIKSAFRLLPIHPEDFELLGFKFQNLYFVDRCLPMGASSSCYLFECFSSFLEFQLKKISGSLGIVHYLDDFLLCAPAGTRQCVDLLCQFQAMCDELGVPLAPEKTVGPVQSLTYLGLEIDSVSQSVKVPLDKLKALVDLLDTALSEQSMTLRSIQSLIGSLNFVCRAIAPGRAFLRRLIDLTVNETHANARIRIGRGAREDIKMWIAFLRRFNGTSMFLDEQWLSNSTLELFTDASGSIGFGAYFQGRWANGLWPQWVANASHSIAFVELFPVVVAMDLWGHHWRNMKIKLWSDNKAVVCILNKQTSPCPDIMQLVRKLVLLALSNNILFKGYYVEGVLNGISDALSRFQDQRFRELAPDADLTPTPLPQWAC